MVGKMKDICVISVIRHLMRYGRSNEQRIGVVNWNCDISMMNREKISHGHNPVNLCQHDRQRIDIKSHNARENDIIFFLRISFWDDIILPPYCLYRLNKEYARPTAHIYDARCTFA